MLIYVVCYLPGNSPASEFYMPTFRNTLSVPSSQADRYEGSETSAYKIQTPGNYPEESIQHTEQGESLKSRMILIYLLTAVRLTPGGSSTVHIYIQTVHRTTQY